MEITNVLEWEYSPKSYFEKKREFYVNNLKIKIEEGKIYAKGITGNEGLNRIEIDEIFEKVKIIFLGAQLINEIPFEIFNHSYKQFNEEGKERITLYGISSSSVTASGKLEYVKKDKDGNIIYDSKQERIKEIDNRINQVKKLFYIDIATRHLITIYHEAKTDKERMFFLLYEIPDVLKKVFGNSNKVIKKLNISKTKWGQFTRMLNNLPVNQGRHRGRFMEDLRELKNEEESELFKLGSEFIKRYIDYKILEIEKFEQTNETVQSD